MPLISGTAIWVKRTFSHCIGKAISINSFPNLCPRGCWIYHEFEAMFLRVKWFSGSVIINQISLHCHLTSRLSFPECTCAQVSLSPSMPQAHVRQECHGGVWFIIIMTPQSKPFMSYLGYDMIMGRAKLSSLHGQVVRGESKRIFDPETFIILGWEDLTIYELTK